MLACSSMSAQVYVSTNGNVGVRTSANDSYSLSVNSKNRTFGLYLTGVNQTNMGIFNQVDSTVTTNRGIKINNYLMNGATTSGLEVGSSGSSNSPYYGVKAYGGNTTDLSIGVMGGLYGDDIVNGAGIYGSSTATVNILPKYAGKYAGYFRGDVRVTGTLFANVLTPSTSPGPNGGSGSQTIQVMSQDTDAAGESVSDKLSQVQVLRIGNNTESQAQTRISNSSRNDEYTAIMESIASGTLSGEEVENALARANEIEEALANDETVDQTEKAAVSYGLAADQLKAVYPELVYEDANGNVSINYVEMVPLLVQSIRELNNRVSELESENAELRAENEGSDTKGRGIASNIANIDADILSLAQNVPNPFTDKTTIDVNIPGHIQNAAIFIYDMSGKQIDKIQVSKRGASQISVSGTGLSEGMYLYSLIADGKVVDTRKMILTR